MQKVEGLVYGSISIYMALRDELVVYDSLQALGQVYGLLLKGLLLLLNGSRLPFHLDSVLLQVLILPALMKCMRCTDEIGQGKMARRQPGWQ